MKTYRAGIDVGSTTVKLVILDDAETLFLVTTVAIMPIPKPQ